MQEVTVEEILVKLGLSLIIGTVIGGEREYRNKAAGLRTVILICMGSTLFTIVSASLGAANESGRIASNIVTGIGFLGAGAIMREGLTVSGLTTASCIWATAALGMAVGAGEYYLGIIGTMVVLLVLTTFGYLQSLIERYHKTIELYITVNADANLTYHIEMEMKNAGLNFEKKKQIRRNGDLTYQYDVWGKDQSLTEFITLLSNNRDIKSYEY